MAKLDYTTLPDEWLERLEQSAKAATQLLLTKDGRIKKSIEASEVRSAEFLYALTEKRAMIAAVKTKREEQTATVSELQRENAKLKKELAKERGRNTRLNKELDTLKQILPVHGNA